ncbi:type VI secretion system baseplate subunit TssF [Klebsiella pneumoniae]|uniref:type VI secretion system baseplate subunit TssF n=1 Tax=Klebsiella pneumoniae TaxID=573 RepID=UPI00136CFC80|nr:type VI secretion system baseplate subunit TssF [Klebsiella pneumoniae]MXM00525.1 hypothetical protein [Klebsiella pneumoniae]
MDDLTLRYYDAEMRYLLEAGEEFARAHPEQAAMLNLDNAGARDPFVERLFEGFAFLMGRMREKLDDDLPELTEGVVSLLWPHYLRTIPSMSVVEFTPDWPEMKEPMTMAKGFEVLSRPIGEKGTRCRYTTTKAIALQPLSLERVQLATDTDGRSVITLRFTCSQLTDWRRVDLSHIPLYCNADAPLACAMHDGHTEIYTVDSVISSHQQVYAPFSSFRHKGGMMRHDAADYYYHTRVRRGPSGLYNTWLIVGGEAFDNHTVPEDESLSLTLTGTNGQLPRRALQSTVLDTVMKTTSASIAVRNLCAPTLPCYPPAQDRFHWRVLSHLGSSFLSLIDNAEVLRGTLALYEWTDSEMNRRRLEAILDVKHRATERFAQGHLVRGVQIEVTLDSHGFAGRGDICLFGEMLSRFFALYTDIYLFNRLIIILQPTGERLEWEEKHSRRIPG